MCAAPLKWPDRSEAGNGDEPDDLSELVREVDNDPAALAAYEDAGSRKTVIRALVEAREATGLKQVDVATTIGTQQSVISDLENLRIDPRLSTLQRYARACGRVVSFALEAPNEQPYLVGLLLGDATEEPQLILDESGALAETGDDLDRLSEEVRSDRTAAEAYIDATRRAAVIRVLTAARKRLKLTQLDVAELIGTAQSAISDIENRRIDPRLSTLQRYARACQLSLFVSVTSDNSLTGMPRDLAPPLTMIGDPVVAEGLELTASLGISRLLRSLIKNENQPGVSLESAWSSIELSQPAARRTTNSLAIRGWLEYLHKTDDQRLRLLPNAAAFIGVSIRPDHIRGLAASLNAAQGFGDVYQVPLYDRSPHKVIEAVAQVVDHLRVEAPRPLGVGVELAGPVKGDTGTVVFAPDLQPLTNASWQNFNLEAGIQERLGGLRTVVANDATALATRELLQHGTPGGLIVVTLSESTKGIGAGLVFNGKVITGNDGHAGEIGHIRVPGNNRICVRCGQDRKGCLETIASGYAIAQEIGAEDLASACAIAADGNKRAASAFKRGGRALGRVLGDAMTWLDPARVVVFGTRELAGGPGVQSAILFAEGVENALAKRRLAKSDYPEYITFEDWTGPLSAASVAIDNFLGRPLEYTREMIAHSRL
jgi:predicted NBD/HSP70 family sugar kinase/transcriptional regulator with XRE-family HTH domain